ncbi:MAG: zinc-binding dehydrogenase, partial [Alphaproteobacteria bacterium]
VTGFKVGQKVFGFTLFGGCASHLVVSPHQLAPIPKGWSLEACAALPTTTMTALHALHNLAHIQSGHTVLVQSAAGGVGMALCQLARHAGCHVVSVVGNASKIQTALKAGAHTVFVRSPQLWRHVDAAYPNGFDAVLDACGVSTLRPSFERLKPMGNLVVYGFAEVFPRKLPALLPFLAYNYLRIPSFSPWDMTATNRSVHGFNLAFLEQHTDVGIALLQHVATLAQQGHLQPPPLTVFPVDAVAEAYHYVASGDSVGKTILTFEHE